MTVALPTIDPSASRAKLDAKNNVFKKAAGDDNLLTKQEIDNYINDAKKNGASQEDINAAIGMQKDFSNIDIFGKDKMGGAEDGQISFGEAAQWQQKDKDGNLAKQMNNHLTP